MDYLTLIISLWKPSRKIIESYIFNKLKHVMIGLHNEIVQKLSKNKLFKQVS